MLLGRISAFCLSMCCLCGAQHIVEPDRHWFDTDGNRIEAHAAGMLQSPLDGRWYWYGESYKRSKQKTTDEGINCYSADTIAGPWHFEGQVIKQDDVVIEGEHGPWIMQRPKVLFNDVTQKYVMYWHLDQPKHALALGSGVGGYAFKRVGTATADHAAGPFTFIRGYRPDGKGSLDMNLFKDPLDGQAYLIRDVEHKYVGISRLSEDYLNSTGIIAQIDDCEGMAMFRLANGTYYLITSHLTGWDPNPLIAWRSKGTTLDGAEWINMGNPTQDKTSFNSQPTYVVQYTPQNGSPYWVYMGDDWLHCPNDDGSEGPLENACYVWLPIMMDVDGASLPLQIDNRKRWDLEDPFAPPPPPTTTPAPPPPPPGCALEEQYSGTDCVEGSTFGCYANDTMWTTGGCRGRFTCPSGTSGVECNIKDEAFSVCECKACTIEIEEQYSSVDCKKEQGFGCYPSGGMWTDKGCRGRFTCNDEQGVECDMGGDGVHKCDDGGKILI